MLRKKDKDILLNIINSCIRIEDSLINVDRSRFGADIDIKDIICFNIMQIGELVKLLSNELVIVVNSDCFKVIEDLSDVISHNYSVIDWDQAWNTATNDIRPLHDYCCEVLSNSKQTIKR